MDICESILAEASEETDDDEHFERNEKFMIRSVFTLTERPVMSVMILRRDVKRLDIPRNGGE